MEGYIAGIRKGPLASTCFLRLSTWMAFCLV